MKKKPCIGCDGQTNATGPDGWCDECRHLAKIDEIPPASPEWIEGEQDRILKARRKARRAGLVY